MLFDWVERSIGDDFGGEVRNACKSLVGNPKRKKQLGKPRRRW